MDNVSGTDVLPCLSLINLKNQEKDDLITRGEVSRGNITRIVAEAFVKRFYERTGKRPIIYGSVDFLNEGGFDQSDVLTQCKLWIANWTTDNLPRIPGKWTDFAIWNYSDGTCGKPPLVPGIGECNRDRYNGITKKEVYNFLSSNSINHDYNHKLPSSVLSESGSVKIFCSDCTINYGFNHTLPRSVFSGPASINIFCSDHRVNIYRSNY